MDKGKLEKTNWSQKVKGWSIQKLTSEYPNLREWFSLQPSDVNKILAGRNGSKPCHYSCTTVILLALCMNDKMTCEMKCMVEWIRNMFPYFRSITDHNLSLSIRRIFQTEEYLITFGSRRWRVYTVDPWLQERMRNSSFYRAKDKLMKGKEASTKKNASAKTLNETDILDLVELKERKISSSREKPSTMSPQSSPDKGPSDAMSPIPMLPLDDSELIPNRNIRLAQQKFYSENMCDAEIQVEEASLESVSSLPQTTEDNPMTSDPIVTIENLEDDTPDPMDRTEILKISPRKGEHPLYKHAVESNPLVVLKDVMKRSIDEIYKDTLRMQSSSQSLASSPSTDAVDQDTQQQLSSYQSDGSFSFTNSLAVSDVISPTQNSPYVQAQPAVPFVPSQTISSVKRAKVLEVLEEKHSSSGQTTVKHSSSVLQSTEKKETELDKTESKSQNSSNSKVVPPSQSPKPVALYKAERRIVKDGLQRRGKKSTNEEILRSSKPASSPGNSTVSQAPSAKQTESTNFEMRTGEQESPSKFSSSLLSQASQGIKLAVRGLTAKNYVPYKDSVKKWAPEYPNTLVSKRNVPEAQINEITSSSDSTVQLDADDTSVSHPVRKKFKGSPSEKQDSGKNIITRKSPSYSAQFSTASQSLKTGQNIRSEDVINLCDDDEDNSGDDDIQIVGETKSENVTLQSRLTVQRIGDVVFENIAIVRNKDYDSESDNDSVQIID